MTAAAVYARRYARVLLADPQRRREVFTAAKARGEAPAVVSGPWEALADAWLQALSWPKAS